jgi:hypothetical protein
LGTILFPDWPKSTEIFNSITADDEIGCFDICTGNDIRTRHEPTIGTINGHEGLRMLAKISH